MGVAQSRRSIGAGHRLEAYATLRPRPRGPWPTCITLLIGTETANVHVRLFRFVRRAKSVVAPTSRLDDLSTRRMIMYVLGAPDKTQGR